MLSHRILFLLPVLASFFCFEGSAQIDPKGIDIVRDKWGVAHIYAETDPETAYGLAWANAEDDFKTMQITILAAKSMAGRVFGPQGAAADYFVQFVRAKELVSREIKNYSPDFLALMSGYVEGINSYASQHPEDVLLKEAFPISVEEMLNAWVLSLSSISGATTVVSNLFNNLEQGEDGSWSDPGGSNAIAISSSITDNNETFLAINSHQPLQGPDSWYEVHLNSNQGWNMLGGTFPGGAMVFHGVNPYLGWAHTVNYPDKVDVFKLNMVTGEKDQYFLDGESLPLQKRKIKLKAKVFLGIKIGVKKTAYWSEFGPVIKNKNGYYAIRYGSMMDLSAPLQWYRMNKATNWGEFYDALRVCGLPGFNIVYADIEDNIFFTSMAILPKRKPGLDWKGIIPGFTSDVIWNEFYPVDSLPQLLNPESGYLFNVNNTVYNATGKFDNIKPGSIQETMGFPYRNNNRSIRIQELFSETNKSISYSDFKRIKYDLTLPDSLHYIMDLNPLFRMTPTDYPEIEDYLTIFQRWDKKADFESVGATLFKAVYDILARDPEVRNSKSAIEDAVVISKKQILKDFGTLEVPLGEYQVHAKGDVTLPIQGVPDVIASMSTRKEKKQREKAYQGESYIMMVRFTDAGPVIETVNAYGASNHENSKHYTDQMELFVNQQLKPMTLDKNKIYDEAERVYHPMN